MVVVAALLWAATLAPGVIGRVSVGVREPAPDASLADLGRRRVDATRERLTIVEGIPAARVTSEEGERPASLDTGGARPTSEPAGEGRVEFAIVAGE